MNRSAQNIHHHFRLSFTDLWWGYRIMIVFLVGLGLVQLLVSASLATKGEQLAEFTRETQQLQLDNQSLSVTLHGNVSLQEIALRAKMIGLVPVTNVLFSSGYPSVALR
jgi:hypothetical protein